MVCGGNGENFEGFVRKKKKEFKKNLNIISHVFQRKNKLTKKKKKKSGRWKPFVWYFALFSYKRVLVIST